MESSGPTADSRKLEHGSRMIYADFPSFVWGWRTVVFQLSVFYYRPAARTPGAQLERTLLY